MLVVSQDSATSSSSTQPLSSVFRVVVLPHCLSIYSDAPHLGLLSPPTAEGHFPYALTPWVLYFETFSFSIRALKKNRENFKTYICFSDWLRQVCWQCSFPFTEVVSNCFCDSLVSCLAYKTRF